MPAFQSSLLGQRLRRQQGLAQMTGQRGRYNAPAVQATAPQPARDRGRGSPGQLGQALNVGKSAVSGLQSGNFMNGATQAIGSALGGAPIMATSTPAMGAFTVPIQTGGISMIAGMGAPAAGGAAAGAAGAAGGAAGAAGGAAGGAAAGGGSSIISSLLSML